MEINNVKLEKNPKQSASLLSQLFFAWSIPIFKKTCNNALEPSDSFELLRQDSSAELGDRLERNWRVERKTKKSPSLVRAVMKTFWLEISIIGILHFVNQIVVRLTVPFILENLLSYYRENSSVSKDDAIKYGTEIVVITILAGIGVIHYSFNGLYYALKIRVAVCSVVYRKSLLLSQKALSETGTGKLVNLLSNDICRLNTIATLHPLWVAPLYTILAGYILWTEMQWAGMFGMVIVFLVVPIQSYAGKVAAMIRFKTAFRTDERVRFMNEVIAGVQVIKMYAWEKPFAKFIATYRRSELRMVLKSSHVRAFYMSFIVLTNRLAMFCTVVSIVLLYGRETIQVSKIFMVSYLFNMISQSMCQQFVRGIAEMGEALVSFRRIQAFLECAEKDEKISEVDLEPQSVAISLTGVAAGWERSSRIEVTSSDSPITLSKSPEMFMLKGIDIEVRKGSLVFVIGSIGAGKSTLLQVLLQELPSVDGAIKINGSISYASQENWIFNSTIRQNITFDKPFDQSRYDEILRCTDLANDFKELRASDMTLVGDNGTGLSGGQKARINLARALYRKADIYLLDDPLSAVDAHVQSHIFNECIGGKGFLARQNATRVLTTHQIQYLKEADWIIVLNEGKVEAQGVYDDISNSGIDFTRIMHDGGSENKTESSCKTTTITLSEIENIPQNETNTLRGDDSQHSFGDGSTVHPNLEATSKGTVQGSLIVHYLRAANCPFLLVIVVVSFCLSQILASGADIWVSHWIRKEESRFVDPDSENGDQADIWSTETYIYIYASIMGSLFVFALMRSITFFHVCTSASANLHDMMFDGIISTSMRFFDANPSGRIMNRFSKDLGSADEELPKTLLEAMQLNLFMFGAILVTCYTNALFAVVVLVMGGLFYTVLKVYLKSSKNIKRLEGRTKSPVFTHIASTLNGLTTIRAFQAERFLRMEFDVHQDLNTSSWFMFIATSTGFGMALDLIVYAFIGCIIYTFLLLDKGTTGDRVGLAITQALALTGALQRGVRVGAEVSNYLMAVERILEYCHLVPEKQSTQSRPQLSTSVSESWPDCGKITFQDVFCRYDTECEPVLRGLSFTIQPREKVSIVGRTGAGKSSLISAIFRLAVVDGKISIDGYDISCIDLDILRSKISIIPQTPTLFSGTLRRNLDPFDEYSDDEIWKALEDVEMKDVMTNAKGLMTPVSAHGQNFSVGQRQILCLARAILRKNRIIILDEATANVDLRTDEMIQHTIREKFRDCTVIVIAHRLHTVIDSDRVLVMNAGTVVEFDAPYSLMQKENGVFRSMTSALGPEHYSRLLSLAKDSCWN